MADESHDVCISLLSIITKKLTSDHLRFATFKPVNATVLQVANSITLYSLFSSSIEEKSSLLFSIKHIHSFAFPILALKMPVN